MAWKYIKDKGWTNNGKLFYKQKYIKNSDGSYGHLDSGGTYTVVYKDGEFTPVARKLDLNTKNAIQNGMVYDINPTTNRLEWRTDEYLFPQNNYNKTKRFKNVELNTVNPNSPEGIAKLAEQRIKRLIPNIEEQKRNEALMQSENPVDRTIGLSLEESRLKSNLTEKGKDSVVAQKIIRANVQRKQSELDLNKDLQNDKLVTDGLIALAVSKLGKTNAREIINYYALNDRDLYNNLLLKAKGKNELEKELFLLNLFTNKLNQFDNVIGLAFEGSNHDDILTNLSDRIFSESKKNSEENKYKNIAANIYRYTGNKNINDNWSLHQIRAAGEDKGNGNSSIIDKNDDYYKRIYALRDGERRMFDIAADAAVITLATKGAGQLIKNTNLVTKYTPDFLKLPEFLKRPLTTYEELLTDINTVGERATLLPKSGLKALQFTTDIVTYPIAHPISTATYSFVTPTMEEKLTPYLGKRGALYASSVAGFATSAGVRNYLSQGLLNTASKAGIKLGENGLARTYRNGFFSEFGTDNENKLFRRSDIPVFNRRAFNYGSSIGEGLVLGVPLTTLDILGIRPSTKIADLTGSELLGNVAEAATFLTLGKGYNRMVARKGYSRGAGAENINQLHKSAERKSPPPATESDPVTLTIARTMKNPVLTALARFLPSYWGVGGSYNGNSVTAYDNKGKQTSAADIKMDRHNAIEHSEPMVPELGTRGLKNLSTENRPGSLFKLGTIVAGNGIPLSEQLPKNYAKYADLISKGFSLGRYKPGQLVTILGGGDSRALITDLVEDQIKAVVVDENDKIQYVPLSKARLVGVEGALPLQRAYRTKDDKYYWHALDTQGHHLIPYYNERTKKIEYLSLDNSGLGHSLVKDIGSLLTLQGWKDLMAMYQGAFIENNMAQAYNTVAHGGPDARPGTGRSKNKTSFYHIASLLRPKVGKTPGGYTKLVNRLANELYLSSALKDIGPKLQLDKTNAGVKFLPTVDIFNASENLPSVTYDYVPATYLTRLMPLWLQLFYDISGGFVIPEHLNKK